MSRSRNAALLAGLLLCSGLIAAQTGVPGAAGTSLQQVAPAPNGVAFPEGFRDWKTIGISYRSDNNTLRAIFGNEIAIRHARNETGRQWPTGSVLVKVVWKQQPHPEWESAATPGDLVHVEVMEKDVQRFPYTGGWGFGRWVGERRVPHGDSAEFAKQCFGCHEPVAQMDYVFTRPVFARR